MPTVWWGVRRRGCVMCLWETTKNGLSAWCEFESCHIYAMTFTDGEWLWFPSIFGVNPRRTRAKPPSISGSGVPGWHHGFGCFHQEQKGMFTSKPTGLSNKQTGIEPPASLTNSPVNLECSSVSVEHQRARCGTACDRCCQSSEGWYIFTTSIWMAFAKTNHFFPVQADSSENSQPNKFPTLAFKHWAGTWVHS